jgi:hypothetical protein
VASYRSFGGLDDRPLIDGDTGFVGINQRERPSQLKGGQVVLSKNGRIDNYWQPRKGIDLKSGQLANSANPLALPFIVLDSVQTISTASRTSNVVTINLSAAHGIASLDLPAYITLGTPSVATQPITGIDAGSYLMSYVDADSLSFANVGTDSGSLTVNGTYGKIATIIDNNAVSAIYGSCLFSNPASNLDESIIVATNNEAKSINLFNYSITDLPYPTGEVVSTSVEMLQAFDRIYLFREGTRAFEYIPQGRNILASGYTSTTGVVNINLKDHGLKVGDSVTISGITFSATPPTADPNGTHIVTTVVDADNFQYVIATGSGNETYTVATGLMVAAGFTLVPAGAYTQPQYFNIGGNKYGVTNGLVRFEVAGNTTIVAGDTIRITDTDVTILANVIGEQYTVTSATATDIYFEAPLPNVTFGSGTGSDFIEFGSRFSIGLGFTHMPAPKYGVYFQRRLWCPYFYEPAGTSASATYTDRKLRDEICASDILDSSTFDSIASQFRVTAGIADYLVAMHPFYEDNMLVFNRNSIHMITGTQGTLSDTVLREMTREVGCVARKSIATKGNMIMFLSDDGVYALDFVDQYNLRGTEEPLSKAIQPFIDRINKGLAANSVAIYFDNRYFLAVPLDSALGANDAQGNNAILVFNMKNKAWESIDTFGNNDFNITNLLKGQAEERNELYIVNSNGGVHLADANETAQDNYSISTTGSELQAAIDYELQTRGYTFDDYGRKKFKKATIQMQSGDFNASDVDFLFSTEDPDSENTFITDIATMLDVNIGLPGQLDGGENADFSFRLGNPRGVYGVLTIKRKIVGSTAIGRPKVTSIAIESTKTNGQTITQY